MDRAFIDRLKNSAYRGPIFQNHEYDLAQIIQTGPNEEAPAASNVLMHGTLSAHTEASHEFTPCPTVFIRLLAVPTG